MRVIRARNNFIKMHGLGNDFVLFDARRDAAFQHPYYSAQTIANRHYGVGCDQVIWMIAPMHGVAPAGMVACGMRIWNADGTEVDMCGNAARCVGYLLLEETPDAEGVYVDTRARRLRVHRSGATPNMAVDMGPACWEPSSIPLVDTPNDGMLLSLRLGAVAPLHPAMAVSMGNPHVVILLPEEGFRQCLTMDAALLEAQCLALATHPIFPEGVNVSLVACGPTSHHPRTFHARVWERGTGFTQACGSAACAIVACALRGQWMELSHLPVPVCFPGGVLWVKQDAAEHLWIEGPVQTVYRGSLDPSCYGESACL